MGKVAPTANELEELKTNFLAAMHCKQWLCLEQDEFEFIEELKNKEDKHLSDEQLLDFCIDFTYNTNAIENSSLTKEETVKLLKEDISPNKPFKDQIESFSHQKVFMDMIANTKPLSIALIKKWHKDMFKGAKPDIAGKFRKKNVRVAQYKAPHHMDLSYLLQEFIDWYKDNRNKMHAVEFAALTHLKFVKIHPFMDGNGRIGRMLLNYILHKNGYPMMTVEYNNRESYYEALDKYDDTQEEEIFVRYVIDSYVREHNTPAQN